jgi:hypothetical protein
LKKVHEIFIAVTRQRHTEATTSKTSTHNIVKNQKFSKIPQRILSGGCKYVQYVDCFLTTFEIKTYLKPLSAVSLLVVMKGDFFMREMNNWKSKENT